MPPAGRMEDDVLRKLGATLLALPVLALVYVAVLGRGGMARFGAGLAVPPWSSVVVVAGLPPAHSSAVPVSSRPHAVDGACSRPSRRVTGSPSRSSSSSTARWTLGGSRRAPPGPRVRRLLRVGRCRARRSTIAPVVAWAPDTLYTLTVSKAARAADGGAS